MSFSGGQWLPMLKEVKDWDQWFRALKGMVKMNEIYRLLDRKLNRLKEGQFQNVLEFEAEDAVYQAGLDRLEEMISMSLGMRAAAHVVTTEEFIKIISKLQSAYQKKLFTRQEELLQIVISADETNTSMSEWVKVIKRARNRLIKMGYPVSDWLVSSCFLHSLLKWFERWIDMMYNIRTKELDIDEGKKVEFDVIADDLIEKEK